MDEIISKLELIGKFFKERNGENVFPILHKQMWYYCNWTDEVIRGRDNFIQFIWLQFSKPPLLLANISYSVFPISDGKYYLISIFNESDDQHPFHLMVHFKKGKVFGIYQDCSFKDAGYSKFLAMKKYNYARVDKISNYARGSVNTATVGFSETRGKLVVLSAKPIKTPTLKSTSITFLYQPPKSLSTGGWMNIPNMDKIRTCENSECSYRIKAVADFENAKVYFNNSEECLIYEINYFPVQSIIYCSSIEINESSNIKSDRFDLSVY